MHKVTHKSASSSHYNKEAQHYDAVNEHSAAVINKTLEQIFKKYKVETILDLTCGTGLQVVWLSRQGFEVVGYDINSKMLNIAKENKKASPHLRMKFAKGDMRTTRAGKFDAAITIFNSIGHLTKEDFEKTIQNVSSNLKIGGLYVFDIFNLNYLLEGNNITKLTIDVLTKYHREIQYSTISEDGILASYDIYHEQEPGKAPKITKAFQTLQVYDKAQLKEMVESRGFKVIKQCDVDGSKLYDTKTARILTVAKKKYSF